MKRQRRTLNRTAVAWGLIAASFLSAPAGSARAQAPAPATPLLWLEHPQVDALPPSEQAIGADPRGWRALLSAGADVRHVEAFPGVEAVLRGDAARLEVLLTLGPGVDPSVVELQLADATAVEADGHGHVIVRTPSGDVVLLRPGLQQATDDGRRALAGGWRDAGEGRLALAGPTSKEATTVGFRVLFLPEALTELDRNTDGRVTLEELAPPPATLGGPIVDATKRDTLVIDNDVDGQADPGDTLSYDVRIDNAAGGTSAGSVVFADPLDPNLTLVPGSINVSPLALDETYQAIGHVTLTVSNPLLGLFANDSEYLGDTFALTSPPPNTPTATAQGGTVTIAADGTFSYTSPAGFAGPTDSFTYTISDAGGLTGTGTVTLTVAGLVWFIDRDAAPGGTGTQASPFDELADVNGAGGAGDPDAPNHILYLHDRAAAIDYVLGLELEPGQQLVGSGVPLVVGATTVLPATTPPTVHHVGGNAITLASGATVSGLNVQAANNAAFFGTGALGTANISSVAVTTSGTGAGLSLLNHAGSVTFAGSVAGSGSGAAVLVDGGNGAADLSTATVSKTAGRIVHVRNRTGGTVTFGSVSGTASVDAVAVEANAPATVTTFSSGLNVNTTGARALFANNGGTVNVAGTSSVLNATGAAAIDATGTTFGGGGSFASVSSASSTAEGVRLVNVSGALTMGSGTITGPIGTAFSLAQGNSAVTYGGSISKTSAGRAVDVTARTGGTATFGGQITATGPSTGINVSGATASSTVNFNGPVDLGTSGSRLTGGTALTVNHGGNPSITSFTDLEVFTTGQPGINASNGGTLNVTSGQVDAGGRALNLDGLTLGATLTQVVSTGSAAEGVRLNNASGTLSVGTTTITGPATQGISVAGTSAAASFGTTNVSGVGTQRILVGTTTGNVTFGATTLAGGTDAVSLQNNSAGTRTFASIATSGNTGVGFLHGAGGGATTVNGATIITNPGGTGVDVQGSASAVTFNGVTVNKSASAGTGVNLASNTLGPSFGALNVTASNGTGIAIATSPIATSGGTVTATNGPAINASTAAFSGTLTSASSTNSTTQGISLTGSSGTYSIGAGSITGAAGTAFAVSGGNPTFGYAGSVTQNNAQRSVDVQNTTGGGITVATVTGGASSTGVNINAANGGVTFSNLTHGTSVSRSANQAVTVTGGTGTYSLGAISLFTSSSRGIVATNADGTLNVTSGEVDASANGAVDIDGPAGLTTLGVLLTRANAGGGTNGLRIQDTNGAFEVLGDGASDPANTTRGRTTARLGGGTITLGSGGTLSGASQVAANLNNATNITLRNMTMQTNVTGGVSAATTAGLTLDNVLISGHANNSGLAGTATSGLALQHAEISGNGTSASAGTNHNWNVRFGEPRPCVGGCDVGLTGTATIANSLFFNSIEHVAGIVSGGASTLSLTVTNSEFRDTNTAAPGAFGLQLESYDTANVSASITGSLFQHTRSSGLNYAGNDSSGGGTLTVTGNSFVNNGVDMSIGHQGPAKTVTVNASNNTTRQIHVPGSSVSLSSLIGGASSATTFLQGTMSTNVVGNPAVADSGSVLGAAMAVESRGAGTFNLRINNNNVRSVRQDSAFYGSANSGSARLNVTGTGNIFNINPSAVAFAYSGVELISGGSGGGDATRLCANLAGNTAFIGHSSAWGIGTEVLAAAAVIDLVGYAGPANNLSQITTYLGTLATTVTPTPAPVIGAGTIQGTGTACPTPP
ncbi:MAG: Ig-like domain-containing protein [Vicinamibacteria bacterium]